MSSTKLCHSPPPPPRPSSLKESLKVITRQPLSSATRLQPSSRRSSAGSLQKFQKNVRKLTPQQQQQQLDLGSSEETVSRESLSRPEAAAEGAETRFLGKNAGKPGRPSSIRSTHSLPKVLNNLKLMNREMKTVATTKTTATTNTVATTKTTATTATAKHSGKFTIGTDPPTFTQDSTGVNFPVSTQTFDASNSNSNPPAAAGAAASQLPHPLLHPQSQHHKPPQTRQEVIEQIRFKLRAIQKQEVSASGRKRTLAAAAATAGGIDDAGTSTVGGLVASSSLQARLFGGRQQQQSSSSRKRPRTMDEIIIDSNTKSIKFLDIIVLCTVLDNYIFGAMVFVAAIAEIIIGWLYLNSCNVSPNLPNLLILNGVLNILEVYTRNLSNNGRLSYFVMTIFRLMAFYSFVVLMVVVFLIDPRLTFRQPPTPEDLAYVDSIGPILYCHAVLYFFTYYLVLVFSALISLLTGFGLVCIIYMHVRQRAEDSKDSKGGGAGGGSSTSNKASDSYLSYHRFNNKQQQQQIP